MARIVSGSVDHDTIGGVSSDDHHTAAHNLDSHATRTHANLQTVTSDQHHAQAHSVASHSDTTITGTETETLSDGSDADALHIHVNAIDAILGGMIYG